MKYPLPTEPIPQSARKQINEKLLYLIDNDTCAAYDVSKADVFQAYTGRGGLHGLQRSDYNSYAAYSEAKKEAENGQVFTPARLCQFVVDCLHIGQDDLIADLTCGMGTFFNFLPNERNAYGCELDIDAYKVAAFLFPQAHLEIRMSAAIRRACSLIISLVIHHIICAGGWKKGKTVFRSFTTVSRPQNFSSRLVFLQLSYQHRS